MRILIVAMLFPVLAAAQRKPPEWANSGLKGKLDSYVSKMDGKTRPYGICLTSESAALKPLVVIVSPGASTEATQREATTAEQYAWYAKKNGKECIALRATGRGPGSVYQNYGELDVLEAIEDAAKKYPVDRDRISVTGMSMGGAATWYLTSHYPDLFAAGGPMAGYCDYRLWEKPGGYTYPMQPWEEPSWQARSAAFLPGNFEFTSMAIVHGEWDRAVGGGVPVQHSRQMFAMLKEKGYKVQYTELAKTGHSAPPEVIEKTVLYLLDQKKERNPKHVSLTTWELRHNRSYWVGVDQIEHYGRRAFIDADQAAGGVQVKTENIRAFTLGPVAGVSYATVSIDGRAIGKIDLTGTASFQKAANGRWSTGAANGTAEKHHGCSGPVSDIFFDNLLLVPGTIGNDADTNFNMSMAGNTRGLFSSENGGLHRGGIRGSNTVDLVIVKDTELTEDQIRNNNLLLFGNIRSNAIFKRYWDKIPLLFEAGAVSLGGRTFNGAHVSVFAVFPHPENPGRYVAVHGGYASDAVTWGSHLSLQLLPDYLVYDGGKMLDWGFWDNTWQHLESMAKK